PPARSARSHWPDSPSRKSDGSRSPRTPRPLLGPLPIGPELRWLAVEFRHIRHIMDVLAVRTPFTQNLEGIARGNWVGDKILIDDDANMAHSSTIIAIDHHIAHLRLMRTFELTEPIVGQDLV